MSAAPLIQFPRAELQQLVQEITDTRVIWDGEPLPFVGGSSGKPGYWIELAMGDNVTKGVDEDRVSYDPVNQVNDTTQISYRIYTVSFRVVSNSFQVPAFDVMDQIRRGLRSLTAKTEYTEIGIAFVDYGRARNMPVPADNRSTSECVMDVRIAWQVSADPGDDDGTIIKSVEEIVSNLSS